MLAAAEAVDLGQLSTMGPLGLLCLTVITLASVVEKLIQRAFSRIEEARAEKRVDEGKAPSDPIVAAVLSEMREMRKSQQLLPDGGTEQRLRLVETELAELRGERRRRLTGSHPRVESEE